MRCDKANGWAAMRSFMHSAQPDAVVTLNQPSRQEVQDYQCSDVAPLVRLVRQVTSDGQIRVLATNLPATDFPASVFGDLYHQR